MVLAGPIVGIGAGANNETVYGGVVQVGYEVGDFFSNQFSLQYVQAGSPSPQSDVQLLSVGYQLTLDLFHKSGISGSGFTPYVGAGLFVGCCGAALIGPLPALEVHGTGGVRYTTHFGLALRAELLVSTLGSPALIPELGLAYRF